MENLYYVYEDDDHTLYYYNCETEESTYDKPKNATFLDPDTNKPYVFPDDDKTSETDSKTNDEEAEKQVKDSDDDTPKKTKKSKKSKKTSDTESSKEIESEKEQDTPNKKSKKSKKSKKTKKTSDIDSEQETEHKSKHENGDKKVRHSSSQVNDDEKDEDEDSGSKESITTYYVYMDENNQLYYFDAKTKSSTYDKPENAKFLDPKTNEAYVFEEETKPKKKKSKKSDAESDKETPKKSKKSKESEAESDKETPKKTKKSKESEAESDKETPKKSKKSKESESDSDKEKSKKTKKAKESESDSDKEKPKKAKKAKESSSTSASESDSESSDDDLDTYFVYYNDKLGKYYYYHSVTKETTYDKPEKARFLDPVTSEKFVFDEEKVEKKKKSKKERKESKEKKEKKDKKKDKKEKKEKVQSDNEQQNEKNQSDAEQETESKSDEPAPKAEEKPRPARHARFLESNTVSEIPTLTVKARSDTVPMKKNKGNKSTIDLDMIIDVPREVSKFDYTPSKPKRVRTQSFMPDAANLALPANLQQDIHKFQVDEYAKKFFKEHRSHHIFSRKRISPENLAAFQDTPLSGSLLESVPKNLQKDSIQCFNYILNYSGATKDKIKNTSLMSLISLIDKQPILRDEVFFQLVKQTNNNPNNECLTRTWQIFLVCASIFPSSRDSEVWIKSHLSHQAMTHKDKKISDYAQFTYIRFSARCTIGKPLENAIGSPLVLNRLIKDVFESKQVFHASIYEQLWNQRATHKLFPVPITVHVMAEMLLQKGAESMEGIFRIVGNKKVVTNMQEKVNKGGEIDPNIALHDLASLFKSWFATLPDTLIPEAYTSALITAHEEKKYIEFAETLPKAHYYTLKYLIGFFQRLVKSEEATKMNASNLAICFGPDVVSTRHVKDLSDFEKFKKMSIDLLTALINDFSTSDIYPLDLGI